MLKTHTQWKKFDEQALRNFNEDGTYAEGIDHKTSIKRNLKSGAMTIALAPVSPLGAAVVLPVIKSPVEAAKILVAAVFMPAVVLAWGLKDLAVDVPLHAAALLLEKT